MEKNKTNIHEDDVVKYQNEYSDEKVWDKAKTFAVKLGGNATYYALTFIMYCSPRMSPSQTRH